MANYQYYRRKARRRVRAKKGFYYHFGVYLIMGMFFFGMNMATDGFDEIWFIFPLLPWGAAVLIHYLVVFGFPVTRTLSRDWEEREYQREMELLSGHRDYDAPALNPGLHSDPLSFDQLKSMYQERWNREDFV